jgi:hypothetical protein
MTGRLEAFDVAIKQNWNPVVLLYIDVVYKSATSIAQLLCSPPSCEGPSSTGAAPAHCSCEAQFLRTAIGGDSIIDVKG